MNLVIVVGTVVTEVEFKFIYDRYKEVVINEKNARNKNDYSDKYNHTSIAKCNIKLFNNSITKIYGYDEIADFMYRNLACNDCILIEGKLDSNMEVKIELLRRKL